MIKIKSGNLPEALRKRIIRHRSSSSTKDGSPSSVKNAGLREDGREHPSNTLLYDSAFTCPLSVYIDVVCDDKLNSLVIKGHPTTEELEEVKLNLIAEFSELSNNGEAQVMSEVVTNLHHQKSLVYGLETSLHLILSGRFDKAVDYLNSIGVRCKVPETEDEFRKLINQVQLKLKNRLAKYKEARSRYNALSGGSTEKPTRRYYNRLLIMLSTCEAIKIQLNPKQMTVAEFAEYLNLFSEYQNQLKIKQNRHKL